MSAFPFFSPEQAPRDRTSDAPLAIDLGVPDITLDPFAPATPASGWSVLRGLVRRVPRAWLNMSAYVTAGALLGLVLVFAIGGIGGDDASASAGSPGVVTDNVVHLGASQLAATCWHGADTEIPAHLTVSMEVGLDGRVRTALAAGEAPAMRQCVEAYVKAWEFLPQSSPSQAVLPFEIDPR